MKTAMNVGSLFSGYGGFEHALPDAFNLVWQVEINGHCQSVLRQHFAGPRVDDVEQFAQILEQQHAKRARTEFVSPDLITGGFPCQDVSVAGRRAGLAGIRSGLWFTFRRILEILAPRWVLIENVLGSNRITFRFPLTQPRLRAAKTTAIPSQELRVIRWQARLIRRRLPTPSEVPASRTTTRMGS